MKHELLEGRPSERDAMAQKLRSLDKPTIATRWIALNGRPAGFDYLRICLAAAVLFWHSYPISYGMDASNALLQSPLGVIVAVVLPMFFCLSGFLVSGSLERNRDLRKFLTLRVIRIYPALCVEVILSALVLGPLLTTLPMAQYFSGPEFFTYFRNTIGWIHYLLPGVFLDNPLVGVVNPSLWTVPYELECYILLSILSLIGFMSSRVYAAILFALSTAAVAALVYHSGVNATAFHAVNGRILVLCFLAGTMIYRFRDFVPYNVTTAVIATVLGVVMMNFPYSSFFAPLFMAYLTVFLGLQNPVRTRVVDSGDYSYGLYLYAGPIQQTTALLLGAANSWAVNVAIALPTTILFALFSWHFVEKPFLKVKRYVLR